MPPVPDDLVEKLRVPAGWFAFGIPTKTIVSRETPERSLFQIVTGLIAYKVVRDADLHLHFYRSTPGTGTRVATLDVSGLDESAEAITVLLEWSPSVHRLRVGELLADGQDSPRQLRVADDGSIVLLGDAGIDVIDVTLNTGGQTVLRSTAIESWRATVDAVTTLTKALASSDHHTQSISANLSIVMLAAGLESYATRRFAEIEGEGTAPDRIATAQKLFPAKRRDEILADFDERVAAGDASFSELVSQSTDLGNWDRVKDAFSGAYGLVVGQLGLSSDVLEQTQSTLRFRNHIVHVSPLALVLDETVFPPNDDVMSGSPLVEKLTVACSRFVEALHAATVALGEPPVAEAPS